MITNRVRDLLQIKMRMDHRNPQERKMILELTDMCHMDVHVISTSCASYPCTTQGLKIYLHDSIFELFTHHKPFINWY
jgi:hypothetical protein